MKQRSTRGGDHPRYTLGRYLATLFRMFRSLLPPGAQKILLLATAPLLDGVYASTVAGGELSAASASHIFAAIAFGLAALSGGGCVAGAFDLVGSQRRQITAVLIVYVAVASGIVLTLIGLNRFQARVEPELRILVALVLIALALDMAGVNIVPSSPPLAVLVLVGSWWALTQILSPHLPPSDLSPFDMTQAALGSLIALVSGLTATISAVIFRPKLEPMLDRIWLNRAGAAAIVLIALFELGVPVSGAVIVLTFVVVTGIGVIRRARQRTNPLGGAA